MSAISIPQLIAYAKDRLRLKRLEACLGERKLKIARGKELSRCLARWPHPRPGGGAKQNFCNSRLLGGYKHPSLASLSATWPRSSGSPSSPPSHSRSSKLFCSFARPSHIPGFSFSCPPQTLSVPSLTSSDYFSQSRSQSEASAPLTWPGRRVEAGPTAEPPPAASQPRRSGGLLGRLHLLFLKRRGAAERHHWSPGPSHHRTHSPAFRKRSSTAVDQKLGGLASER